MRRAPIGASIVTAAVARAGATLPVEALAQSSPANGQEASPLTIVTVPRLAGVRLALDGRIFATGRDGSARIVAGRGVHALQVLDEDIRRAALRSHFSRWGDDRFRQSRAVVIHGPTRLEVGFAQSVLVDFAFFDRHNRAVDPGRISSLTLSSTIGSRESFRPSGPRWLPSGRVARRFKGLEQTRVQYSLERAMVDGSNAVNKAQQRFLPSETRHIRLHLLLHSARLKAHDLLFGFSVGKSIDLIYPDGRRVSHDLNGGHVVLSSLPRGTYRVKVHAWGYSPVGSLALSKDQLLDVKVVSYLDMVVISFLVVALTGSLVLLPRQHLRRRLRVVLANQPVYAALRRFATANSSAPGTLAEDGNGRRRLARSFPGMRARSSRRARKYIHALLVQGVGPSRGLKRYRSEVGQIQTEQWFEAYRRVAREVAGGARIAAPRRSSPKHSRSSTKTPVGSWGARR